MTQILLVNQVDSPNWAKLWKFLFSKLHISWQIAYLMLTCITQLVTLYTPVGLRSRSESGPGRTEQHSQRSLRLPRRHISHVARRLWRRGIVWKIVSSFWLTFHYDKMVRCQTSDVRRHRIWHHIQFKNGIILAPTHVPHFSPYKFYLSCH